jgi:drug/metabolite transporter (DMT)-like permease
LKTKDLLAFLALSLAWGSSFLWIKIAVQELGPFTLVAFRLLFGILGLALIVAYMRPAWPRSRRLWGALAILGTINTAIPFVLISWGEVYIDSAVASILNSSVPLFTTVIAHYFLKDDRITSQRLVALALGFAGVVVLVLRDLGGDSQGGYLALLGQGAVLLASLSYAFSAVYARRNTEGVTPIVRALVPLIAADSLIWVGASIIESPIVLPQSRLVWTAILWLGLIGSAIAYLLYFYLIHSIGPTRASMVTYTFPVIGVALGVVFLNEILDVNLAVGAILIIASIVIVNMPARQPAGKPAEA